MDRRVCWKYGRFAVAAGIAWGCFSTPVKQLVNTPDHLCIPEGQHVTLNLNAPGNLKVVTSDTRVLAARPVSAMTGEKNVSVESRDVGQAVVSTKLFGFVPWKAVHVSVVPREDVVVGGQSIGVVLHSKGLIVIGFQRVGQSHLSPAAEGNVEIGDVVERVNGVPVNSVQALRTCIRSSSGPITLTIRHRKGYKTIQIQPVLDNQGMKHLGMFVRDQATGVGTLTFYDPEHHRFGALGHLISDADTGQAIDGSGPVYDAEVTGLVKGEPGKPGEKRGRFVRSEGELGTIEENTEYGVFGTMAKTPSGLRNHTLPVALPEQVHKGPAEILTVVDGQTVERYHVEIENLVRQDRPDTKSMVIHVTDHRLLDTAGGIIQGMSGSPIVQDGRLVGAVTHVFVSDPTRGYGVYALWMVRECLHPSDESTPSAEDLPALSPRYFSPTHAGGV